MRRLIAFDLPPGPGFVHHLLRVFEAGDAVLPLDTRLPARARARLIEAARPSFVLGSDGEPTRLPDGLPVEEGDAVVVATSGSTGEPKAAVITHDALEASASITNQRLNVDPERDRWLACIPLAHIGGLSVVTRALMSGTPLVVHERFDPRDVELEAERGATLVSLVPTALRRVDASGFRTVLLGGSAPMGALAPNVVTTYGMTETASGVVYDGFPLEGVELAIGDGVLGAEGEILIRSPTLLRSYRDGRDPRLAGGWLPTGDAGELEPSGRLRVLGRMDEAIVTGGEKVWPAAVEAVISEVDEVAGVGVVGVPDPEWGERVVALVEPRHPEEAPALERLREVVKERLAPWAAPKELVVVDALPRTANGKLLRHELASMARARLPYGA